MSKNQPKIYTKLPNGGYWNKQRDLALLETWPRYWQKDRVKRRLNSLHVYPRLNPLTLVPTITALDEPWPFFHFWRHHFWPNLTSSILNFCRRKRSFQWCPDQSDRPNGAFDMHKNAQKVEWKTQSKISCHYTWLLHAKICPSHDDAFLEVFAKSSRGQ